mgnify:CR=1 FL=1
MVEFCDASILAQLARPDMRLAIHYALSWPERMPSQFGALNLAEVGKLTFEAPDAERFPSIPLAYEALAEGEVPPIAYNAANEAAVARFRKGEIGFFDIFCAVEYAMAHVTRAESAHLRIFWKQTARRAALRRKRWRRRIDDVFIHFGSPFGALRFRCGA